MGERIYFEAGDVVDTLIKFIGTDDYKTMLECTYGTDKESGFRAGLMMVPSILMTKCRKFYETGNQNAVDLFACTVKELRIKKGLTIRGLAKLTEVSPSTITRIESGKLHPSEKCMQKLMTALGLAEEDLKGEKL